MSETTPPRAPVPVSQLKPLAVRLSDDLRAQLDIIAQLRDRSVTEEIRVALQSWVTQARSDPKLQAVADEARRQIEAEAQRQRNAIGAIFSAPTTSVAVKTGKATPQSKMAEAAADPDGSSKA